MSHAIYDTGSNYLIIELSKCGPMRGLLVDKGWGNLWDDIASFDGEPRFGSVKLDEGRCAGMMVGARYVGKAHDGKMSEFMSEFEFDGEWTRYASE